MGFSDLQPGYREKILPLHSVCLDLFILRMMGYCEDRTAKPVWFVIDELAILDKLPQLHTALTENRNTLGRHFATAEKASRAAAFARARREAEGTIRLGRIQVD